MNVVYPICYGVDVHKTFFVATLWQKQLQVDLKRAAKLLVKHGVIPEDAFSLPEVSSA